MQVLLIKDVDRFGKKGETKKTTEGYARNFLFPRNLAVVATPGSIGNLKLLKVSWDRKDAKDKAAALDTAKRLEAVTIRVTKKAGEKGRLFGSVTSAEVAELILKETKIEVDKKSIKVDHVKELGQHEVTVRLAPEVKATVKILVLAEDAAQA